MDTLRLQLQPAVVCERETSRGRPYRSSERRAFCANVRALPLDGRQASASGITDDLCERGVFISANRQPPLDSLLLLQIYGPRGNKLALLARVAHHRAGMGYGCEFLDLDECQHAGLLAMLDSPRRILH